MPPLNVNLVASARLRTAAVPFAASILASCGEGVPVGREERPSRYEFTTIMLAVVIPVIAMTLGFAYWFRSSNLRARYLPDWEYSGRIEFIVWGMPALIMLFLRGIACIGSHELDPPRPLAGASANTVESEVTTLDWRWLFIYRTEGRDFLTCGLS